MLLWNANDRNRICWLAKTLEHDFTVRNISQVSGQMKAERQYWFDMDSSGVKDYIHPACYCFLCGWTNQWALHAKYEGWWHYTVLQKYFWTPWLFVVFECIQKLFIGQENKIIISELQERVKLRLNLRGRSYVQWGYPRGLCWRWDSLSYNLRDLFQGY